MATTIDGEETTRPRRRRRGASHICPHCTRVFKRSEHLGRHVRTHTKEKPFVCTCGAAFTRRDLLTRHHRLSLHTGETQPRDPEPDPDSVGDNDIGASQPSLSYGIGGPVLWLRQEEAPAVPQSSSVEVDKRVRPEPQIYDQPQLVIASQPTLEQCQSANDSFEQFWEFADFLDGIGLPAEWTPYLLGPDLDGTVASEECSVTAVTGGTRAGTPFKSWLPSAPDGDEVPGTQLDQDVPDHVRTPSSFKVTDAQRTCLSKSLENFRDLMDPDFQLPSRHALARYITSYVEGFHSHMVFMHVQTWRILESPLELILSVATIGAQYCFEHRIADRLFHAAKAILFVRLFQKADQFGPKTAALLRLQSRPSTNSERNVYDERGLYGSWEPIDTIRALINIMGYATWEINTNVLEEAFVLQGLLIQVLRDLGLDEEKDESTLVSEEMSLQELQEAWLAWVHQESIRRAKLIAFTFTHTHSIAYNSYPPLRTNEIHLRLPCHTSEWQASTAILWKAAQSEIKKQQLSFQEALSLLLRDSNCALDPIPTPIGNYMILHGLLQRIYIVRDLSLPITDYSASLPPNELDKLEQGLRSWTTSWQQAPESSLDPKNENGPIPFTSSSLLGLAYVRIHLNIGPYRRLETRDPDIIARALMECPEVERSDAVISALLYAAHALSIPVRLGVERVARSQAFFWSVRHSLSGLECAVLLSKWLTIVHHTLDNRQLNSSEARMLHWVRCIVEEALSVVDFEQDEFDALSDPLGLSLAVLKIWAHFFISNTQWRFINIIGVSLQRYRELLIVRYRSAD